MSYKVQTIVFDKSKITVHKAAEWLIKHNYSIEKGVDETDTQLRFRQLEPSYLERAGYTEYRTKPLNNIVSLVLVYKR